MKASGAAVQGALALAGLAVAYATWQREPVRAGVDVVVLDLNKNAVEKLRYDEPAKFVVLERPSSQGADEVWVTTGGKQPPAVEGGADGGTAAPAFVHPPIAAAPKRTLRGNAEAQKTLQKVAPLRVARALGMLPEEKLKELGLTSSQRRLEVLARGATYGFKLGQPPVGVSTAYLQSEADGRVYVLGGSLLGDLEAASTRLVDRRLHDFKQSRVESLSVQSGESTRTFTFQGSDTGQDTRIAPTQSPGEPDEFVKNWHDKVWRLFPTELYGKGEMPSGAEPETKARVEYGLKGGGKGWLELAQAGGDYLARTEHTAGWVKLSSSAEQVLQEAKKVAGAP